MSATIVSCIANGLLWCLVQRIGRRYNAVEQLCLAMPIATTLCVPLAIFFEGRGVLGWARTAPPHAYICLISTPIFFALLMFSKMQVCLHTSGLTVSVSTTFASIVTILSGLIFFNESGSWNVQALVGFAVSTIGLYVYVRLRQGEVRPLVQIAKNSIGLPREKVPLLEETTVSSV